MRLLAIETSCDETSAAVIEDGCVLSNIVSSQVKIHAEYGGVVPELATREHMKNVQPIVQEALSSSSCSVSDLSAIAATRGPGLPPALMIGWKTAQAFAYAINRPLIGVNHVAAHLYSAWFSGTPVKNNIDGFEPNISLIVSGGHTIIAKVNGPLDHVVLGQTQDDAAGECFDKTAKLLGLGYPGGPNIDRLAKSGNPGSFHFARPMLNKANDDLSFSGLKTSVRYFLEKNPSLLSENRSIPDLCASIQAAIVEVLLKKTLRAARREGVKFITVSGGVACNSVLRSEFQRACIDEEIQLRFSPQDMCTDNAGMIGLLGEMMFAQGASPSVPEDDILPNWAVSQIRDYL